MKVYAVAFRMLPSDWLAGWATRPQDLLSDPRAEHSWDGGRVVGRWYDQRVTRIGGPDDDRVEWDAYFLYGPEAEWGEEPPALVSWGRTIVDSRNRLSQDFSTLLAVGEEGKEN
ncbi:MAG: hypothetical protein ACRD1Z_07880 [Vicinamibacteria bacterium]